MSKEALNIIRPHLAFLGIRVGHLVFDVNNDEKVHLAKNGLKPSFTRFNWACASHAAGELPPTVEGTTPDHLLSFVVTTDCWLAAMPEDGIATPDNLDIPQGITIAKTEITFFVDYISQFDPKKYDEESLQEFVQYNSPLHFWPYWRETLQNIAMRAQIVIPFLPPYVVTESKKVLQK